MDPMPNGSEYIQPDPTSFIRLMGKYAKDGERGAVSFLCSFYHDPLRA